jgi:hypothetical protein
MRRIVSNTPIQPFVVKVVRILLVTRLVYVVRVAVRPSLDRPVTGTTNVSHSFSHSSFLYLSPNGLRELRAGFATPDRFTTAQLVQFLAESRSTIRVRSTRDWAALTTLSMPASRHTGNKLALKSHTDDNRKTIICR